MLLVSLRQPPVDPRLEWQSGSLPVLGRTRLLDDVDPLPDQPGSAALVDFLETEGDPERLLGFAREYGYLGLAVRLEQPLAVLGTKTYLVEPLDAWKDAFTLLAWSAENLDALGDTAAVRARVGAKNVGGTKVRERQADPDGIGNAASGTFLSVTVALKHLEFDGKRRFKYGTWYPDRTLPGSIPTRSDLDDSDFAALLQTATIELINRMLRRHASPRLAPDEPNGGMAMRVAADNLFGQMWIETMLRCTGERRYIRCLGCDRWVDVTESRSSRKYCHNPRGVNCRKAHSRATKE
jgi:hypothetical protein